MSAITLPGAQILVTGANGFIGGHLCEHLQQAGAQVRGLVRSLPRAAWLADQGISLIEGGLDEPAVLARAVDGCAAVIHTAAWTGVPDDPALGEAVNVTGAEAVLQAALTAGVARVIHFSSVAVYGVNASPLIDETASTPLVGQAYPDSKIHAEAVVRRLAAAGLDTVIVRPASTYGPRGTAWT
ncbi:MAG: NAD-dependent epimerase/dehydratase family protein, partial [Anaerolineae bacterium]